MRFIFWRGGEWFAIASDCYDRRIGKDGFSYIRDPDKWNAPNTWPIPPSCHAEIIAILNADIDARANEVKHYILASGELPHNRWKCDGGRPVCSCHGGPWFESVWCYNEYVFNSAIKSGVLILETDKHLIKKYAQFSRDFATCNAKTGEGLVGK